MTRRHLHAVPPADRAYGYLELRDQAEQVTCPHCGAQPRQHCHNPTTGDQLRAPAHFQRLDAANTTTPTNAQPTETPASSPAQPQTGATR